MFKKITLFIVIICIAISLSACTSKKVSTTNTYSKIQISYQLSYQEIAEAVGKDK